MKLLDVKQGTDEWHAERAKRFTASEASAMMGASKNTSRSDLLRMKATSSEKEFSEWTENVLFARGHAIEALARPIAEEIIGQELYPATATNDSGDLLASFDGITMLEDCYWECKQWNEQKAAKVREGVVPEEDFWQVVQQGAVSVGAQCLYMLTDGTKEKTIHCWFTPSADDVQALNAGWTQFAEDLANYERVEPVVAPVGEAVTSLPSVSAQVSGSLEIVDNLKTFEVALRDFIDNRLITSPQTDQDFADLDSQIKTLEKAEGALNAAEANVLSMVSAVDMFKRTKDMLHAMARDNRLMAQKLLKAEKENRRAEILQAAKTALVEHMAKVSATLDGIDLRSSSADFPAAMKGKRTITSLKDAADTELARAKIEANAAADKIRTNLELLRTDAAEHEFLFSDKQQLVTQDSEHLKLVIKDRIQAHKAAEEAKLEADRERIRAEEKAKAEAEAARVEAQRQREIAEAERAKQQEQARIGREAQAKADEDNRAGRAAATTANRDNNSSQEVNPEPTADKWKFAATEYLGSAPAAKKSRPADSEIIEVLALHYRVHESKVIEWLLAIDLDEQSSQLASGF